MSKQALAENLKVAVRVRPLKFKGGFKIRYGTNRDNHINQREKERNAKCCVSMTGNVTTLINPSRPDKKDSFTFDHSYWSYDGCVEQPDGYMAADPKHPNGTKFADQRRVFDDLGVDILRNAWDGYNSTLFAYGQTGSGKSWSIIGFKPNDGLVPIICEELFKEIAEKKKAGATEEFEVNFSMLEIFNEAARDLLNTKDGMKRVMKIRENPGHGFYAEGLTKWPMATYEMIIKKMEEGKTNRTIHMTKMNNNSSRAHTIVGIELNQKHKGAGDNLRSAVINLVDLAGSERVSKTEATGDRLKEGAAINQSLSVLGNCIHALAEGKPVDAVPYRNSVLTKLLKNALGGNSRTVMVAAISPADWNYEETLSTLRYADRAKEIKTVATVNENPMEQIVRELTEENKRLKALMASGNMPAGLPSDGTGEDVEEVRKKYDDELNAAMQENEKRLEEMRKSFEEKLKQAESQAGAPQVEDIEKLEGEKKTKPHLSNLNFDSQLTGRIVHILKSGENLVGTHKNINANIVLMGPSILEDHAVITWTENGEVFLEPKGSEARVLYNGDVVTRKVVLHHNDRVLFGATQLYVFVHPHERDNSEENFTPVDYTMAQEEIACKAGIVLPTPDGVQNLDNALLQEDLLSIMPSVQEANSISSELDKRVKFEIVLLPPQLGYSQKTEVCVKMKNLEIGQEYVWHKEKFLNRLYMMKDMYANYADDDAWDLPEAEDPFTESAETEVHIGSVQVFLQPLAYMVELKEQLEINDYKGNEIGLLNLEIVPCDENGKEYLESDDMFVDKPDDLIGRNVHFTVKIRSARGLPNRYTDICCRYHLFLDSEESQTDLIADSSNPKFNYVRLISFTPATKEVISYLHDNYFVIHVLGKQRPRKSAMLFARGKSTREMLKNDHDIMVKTKNLLGGFNINGRVVDPQKQSIIVELLLMKKQQTRLQQRVDGVKKLMERSQKLGRKTVPTYLLKEVFNAGNPQLVEKVLAQLEVEPDDMDEYNMCRRINNNNNINNNTKSSTCNLL